MACMGRTTSRISAQRNSISLKDYNFEADANTALLHLKPVVPGRKEYRLSCGPASYEEWASIFTTFAAAAVPRGAPVIKAGWLEKKGQRRWVVLHDDELYWYRQEQPPDSPDLRRAALGRLSLLYASIFTNAAYFSVAPAQAERTVTFASRQPPELADWIAALSEAEERARTVHERWVREHPALFHIEHRGFLLKAERPLFFVVQTGRLSWFMSDKRSLLGDHPEEGAPPSRYTAKTRFSSVPPGVADDSLRARHLSLIAPSDYVRVEPPADAAPPLPSASEAAKACPPGTYRLEDPHLSIPYYRLYFADRPHYNFVGKDQDGGPVVVSLQKRRSAGKRVKALIRTRKENERRELAIGRPRGLAGLLAEVPEAAQWGLQRCSAPELVQALLTWEERLTVRTYKFGVLYQRAGQADEDALYNNCETSAAYQDFLQWLGTRVRLQGWDRFRGGLNVRDNSTGEHSVYTTVADGAASLELMFHVATLIPHHPADPQQVERKRHLGNDVCLLVFRDADAAGPFDPTIFKSQFNHIFVVLQPDPAAGPGPHYRVGFAAKLGVPEHGPVLPPRAAYARTEHLRQLVLAKLINGERAAMYAPDFKGKMWGTRKQTLLDLIATHPPDPLPPAGVGTGDGSGLPLSRKLVSAGLDVAAEKAEVAKAKAGELASRAKDTFGKFLKGGSAPPAPGPATPNPPTPAPSPAPAPASARSAPAPGPTTAAAADPRPAPSVASGPAGQQSSPRSFGHQRTPSAGGAAVAAASKPLPKTPSAKKLTGSGATLETPAPAEALSAPVPAPAPAPALDARAEPAAKGWRPYVSATQRVRASADAVPVGQKRTVVWVGGRRGELESIGKALRDPSSVALTWLPSSAMLREWLAAHAAAEPPLPAAALRVITNRYRPDDGGDQAADALVAMLRADPHWRQTEVLVFCGEPARAAHLAGDLTFVTAEMGDALRFVQGERLGRPPQQAPGGLSDVRRSLAPASSPVPDAAPLVSSDGALPPAPAPAPTNAAPPPPTKTGSRLIIQSSHGPPSDPPYSAAASAGQRQPWRAAPSSSSSSYPSGGPPAPAAATLVPAPAPAATPDPLAPAPTAAPRLRRVRALWAFQGSQPGDLSFAAGDVITIHSEVEMWLEGSVEGRPGTGIFPSNYVTDLP